MVASCVFKGKTSDVRSAYNAYTGDLLIGPMFHDHTEDGGQA